MSADPEIPFRGRGGLVHGNDREIAMDQIPAARGRAFWSRHDQEVAADLYEAENPGTIVRRPWEKADEHAARLKGVKRTPLPEPQLNMDPARAERELHRRQDEISRLGTDHPEYDKQFAALSKLINQLEQICGFTPTRYTKGVVPKRADDPVPQELIDKLAKYNAAKEETRRKSILAGTDIEFLTLVSQREQSGALQQLAIARIGELKRAETPV